MNYLLSLKNTNSRPKQTITVPASTTAAPSLFKVTIHLPMLIISICIDVACRVSELRFAARPSRDAVSVRPFTTTTTLKTQI